MPERLRVAVAGLGSIAIGHYLPEIKQLPRAELVAVCDVRADWARLQAERFGVPHAFADFDDLLAGVRFDVLVNTSSIPAHFPLNLGRATFAVIDSSYCVKAARGPSLEIYGSAGTMLVQRRGQGEAPFELYRDDRALGLRGWVSPQVRLGRVQQSVGVQDLIDAVLDDRPAVLTPEHARHVIEIMNTCIPAAREGRTVALETTF